MEQRQHRKQPVPARTNVTSSRLAAATAVLAAAATLFAAVGLNAWAAGDAVTARELERQLESEQRRYEQLISEVSQLEDPGRVRGYATDELDMREATRARPVDVDDPGDGERP